eukprot:jgi/Tetstr1/460539/TSEL_005797.t1
MMICSSVLAASAVPCSAVQPQAKTARRSKALLASRQTLRDPVSRRGPSSPSHVVVGKSAVSRRHVVRISNASSPTVDAPTAEVGGAATYDCVVVGGGISGLCTAQALVSKHSDVCGKVLVTEARERVGGNITSMSDDSYLWEEGPNSFQPNDAILSMAVEAGCDKDLVLGDPTAPRFVYWDKKLRPTPSGPDVLTFDLLTIWGKIRAGLGAAGILKAPRPEGEESVEQFVRRNLGDQVFERLIEPFCSGVYAGDPSKLSMKAAFGKVWNLEDIGGSIVGGAIKIIQKNKTDPPPPRDPKLPPKPAGQTVGSFREGLKMLPEAIEANISDKIRCNWKLSKIAKSGDLYVLDYSTPDGDVSIKARSVALTCPSYVAASLLEDAVADAATALSSFDYPPVAAVTLAYPLTAFRAERFDASGKIPGFGQLHPRSQGVTTLGTIYSSSLFPGRCPEGQQLLLNYIGGSTNRGIVNQSQEEIVAQVNKDLRKEGMPLKDDAPEPTVVGVRVWPRAIPQFNVGHQDKLDQATAALKANNFDGVHLGGNYVAGVALGKCVEFSWEYASNIAAYVKAAASK